MTNPYTKGRRTERQVYKMLGKFYFNNPKTFARLKGESQGMRPGDIGVYIHDNDYATLELIRIMPFCIEVKAREEWSYKHLIEFKDKKSHLLDYWKQSVNQAQRARKCPMLIYKKNYYSFMVMLPYNYKNESIQDQPYDKTNTAKNYYIPKNHTIFRINNKDLMICRLDDFLKINKTNNAVVQVRQAYNTLIKE